MRPSRPTSPIAISIGVAVYKVSLGLYPPAFRREFAFDMSQDFTEASNDAWVNDHWRGLLTLWLFTGGDVIRSVAVQWLRSPALITSGLALAIATAGATAVGILSPRVQYSLRPSTPERDELLLLVLTTTVVVIIAAVVILSLMFLRPALGRGAGRRRV